MKKNVVFVLLLLVSLKSAAQLSARWQQIYGGPGSEYGYSVRTCLDQGYILCGSTASNGVSDGYMIRTDSLGLVMWSKTFVGNNVDILRNIRQLPDSGYIMCGYSNSQGNGGYDGWVLRTDKNGDTLWTKYIGTTDWDLFYDVAPTWDNGFVLTGGTYGLGNGDEDMYFVKIDANGNVVWTKTYGGIKADESRAIIQTGDSMLAAVGYSYSLGDTLGDSWILRMDSNGDTLWSRTAGYSTKADKGWAISDNYMYGRIFFCGENEITPGNKDADFGAFYYNGTNQFMYSTGGNLDEAFYGMATRLDGSIAAIGVDYTVGAGSGDMYLFTNRNNFWTSSNYGTAAFDVGYSVDITHDDGYIACGYTEGFNSFLPNVYLVKIDTNNVSQNVLNVREQPSQLTFGSTTIFPNPIQNEASINFDSYTSIEGQLKMEIYDVAGRKVMSIPSSQWQLSTSRNATCIIQTAELNNGCYQYVIFDQSGGKTSGKFIVSH